ncbi:MAG: response regulator [Flavobacteriales bacterium]|nr:response regulator [Flavobacteriales bacterium]
MGVEYEIDKESTLYFTIPYIDVEEKTNFKVHNKDRADGESDVTILIVEDEIDNFIYLDTIIQEYDYNILHAKNGVEAVDLLQNKNTIDLILMDIRMPLKGGFDATIEIRRKNESIPIIATTAYAMAKDRQLAFDLGINDYLEKPISETALMDTVFKQIRKIRRKRLKK